MGAPAPDSPEITRRLAAVEARVARLEAAVIPVPRLPMPPSPAPAAPAAAPHRSAARRRVDLEDLLGGRVLALVGGSAVVLAAVFFLTLAVERGWIGPGVRVAAAAAASAGLVAVGTWLHERRGRTQAALVTVATGIAGALLTLVAATPGYGLLPVAVTLPAAGAVGALATALALRWSAKPIAWLGIGGGLLAPVALAAPATVETLAFLVIAYAAATSVAVARRWHGSLVTAFLLALPQVGWWAFGEPAAPTLIATLAVVGAVPLVAALVIVRRATTTTDVTVPLLLATASTWWLGVLGVAGLPAAAGRWWVVTVALALTAAGAAAAQGERAAAVRRALAAGTTAGGTTTASAVLTLVVGALWTATAGSDDAGLVLGVLTATSATAFCLDLLARRSPAAAGDTGPTDALSLLVLAGVTMAALDGWLQLGVLAAEVVALRGLARVADDRAADVGAACLWVLAALRVLAQDVPLEALSVGATAVLPAVGALALLAATAAGVALVRGLGRAAWTAATVIALGYLASVLVVTAVLAAPSSWPLGAGTANGAQVALGTLWTLSGTCALWAGLRRDRRAWRSAGFVLLGLAVGKAVLFDLAGLELGYRAASFLALGLLLLAAAFVYQRRRLADRTS